jgi:small subunit ribosomal protein S16
MLKIRMQRTGRTNMPTFRIVVTEHTRGPKSANFVEKLGSYNPKTKERILNTERVKHWLSMGAQTSGTMHNMLVSTGVVEGKKINVLPKKSPPKKEEGNVEGAEQAADLPAEASAQAGAPAGEAAESKEEKPAEAAESAKEEAPAVEEPNAEEKKEEQKPAAEATADKQE